jgi:hypothetical protein
MKKYMVTSKPIISDDYLRVCYWNEMENKLNGVGIVMKNKTMIKNVFFGIFTAFVTAFVWMFFLSSIVTPFFGKMGIEGDFEFVLFFLFPGMIAYGIIYFGTRKHLWALGTLLLTLPFTVIFLIIGYAKYFD